MCDEQQNRRAPAALPTREELARIIAFWHGQKMVRQTADGMKTVAALAGYGSWGHSAEKYADARWPEYVSAADAILALLREKGVIA